ncbi:hypothetical protein [Longimicrobium terrae]|uniref:DUF3551 domain-containing protein n=1 Tax=Longimicrobium terrae TaxID=1639882 RepID=A0A841GYE8_9BACT|nr:hypothetical protein [Longimicrobium terrae]MBB4636675.1 hypothetical protein [Longimicrobium terrae]MBB6070801.1 hypothetical protein [Longimicrobium terrae]NNC28827.1 hypothetical protein [Longimicrobium terrae]
MKKQARFNLLAATVVAVGGFALTAPASAASSFGGCEDMHAAIAEHASDCWANGGTSMSHNGRCGAGGYTLTTVCNIPTGGEDIPHL